MQLLFSGQLCTLIVFLKNVADTK